MQVSLNHRLLEPLKTIYTTHRRVRFTAYAGLLAIGALLTWATSNIMPHSWQILLQALPLMPRLWIERGAITLIFLALLAIQVLTLPTIWGILVWASVAALRHQSQAQHQLVLSTPLSWHRVQPDVDTEELVVPDFAKIKEPAMVIPPTYHSQEVSSQTFTSPPPPTFPLPQKSPFWAYDPESLQPLSLLAEFSGPRVAVVAAQPAPLRMSVGFASDPGIKRKQQPNEDTLFAIQGTQTYPGQVLPFGLFAVADGMGSCGHGQEASRLAMESMLESVFPRMMSSDAPIQPCNDPTCLPSVSRAERSNNLSDEILIEIMVNGIRQANRAVFQRNLKETTHMGTTLTASLVIGSKAYIVNVGDSRTYHYRSNSGLAQVTRDHSLVSRMVEIGAISPAEVYTHPQRSVIYRCLGEHPRVEVDSFIIHLQAGDSLLLCSDGLWEMVHDPEIKQIIGDNTLTPVQTSTALIEAALQAGGKDNVSVVVVHAT